MALPSISFIIPLHNNASTVEEAVLSALNQAYGGSVEACVHDDGSSDGGAARVAALAAAEEAAALAGARHVIKSRDGAKDAAARDYAYRRSKVHYVCDNSAKV